MFEQTFPTKVVNETLPSTPQETPLTAAPGVGAAHFRVRAASFAKDFGKREGTHHARTHTEGQRNATRTRACGELAWVYSLAPYHRRYREPMGLRRRTTDGTARARAERSRRRVFASRGRGRNRVEAGFSVGVV